MISVYGKIAVWAETVDETLRLLPLAWTSLVPRPAPLALDGGVVRLAPEALRALASWVGARTAGQGLDLDDREAQKPGDCVGKHVRARATAVAVVGQARAPQAQRRGERR